MRLSIFPTRQMSRACAFGRQQQQQHITTTRSLHTSPAQQHSASSLALASSQSRRWRTNHQKSIATTGRRPYAKRAEIRENDSDNKNHNDSNNNNSQQSPEPSAKPEALPPTHYELFPKTLPLGPPPRGSFAIDVRALRREFLALQAGAHPDLHPPDMRAQAQTRSARINEAYKTLADPLLRAQYVLALRGLDVTRDDMPIVPDPELLMLVWEVREQIAHTPETAELEALRAENEGRIRDSEDKLRELFAADRLHDAALEAVSLRYWINIRHSIDDKEGVEQIPPET